MELEDPTPAHEYMEHGTPTSEDKENVAGAGGARGPSAGGRKSVSGRRRSSGSILAASTRCVAPTEELKRLREEYSRTIKLSSENKINQKNSWSLNLIDNMEEMIHNNGEGDEGDGRAGVNFQRASCTLDASVKIYSYRVDETYQSSYRVLESLSRTKDSGSGKPVDEDDEGNGGGGENGGTNAPKGRARKDASARRGIADTLEARVESINLSNADHDFDVDPLFAKMSKTFDESGSRGMLLNNLCVANGCRVVFDSGMLCSKPADGSGFAATAAAAAEKLAQLAEGGGDESAFDSQASLAGIGLSMANESAPDRAGNARVDVSLIRAKLLQICPEITKLALCPQFEEIRAELAALGDVDGCAAAGSAAGEENGEGGGNGSGGDSDSDDGDAGEAVGGAAPPSVSEGALDGGGDDGGPDFPALDADDGFGEPLADVGFEPRPAGEGGAAQPGWTVMSPETAAQYQQAQAGGSWAAVGCVGLDGDRDHLQERLCSGLEVIENDYAFFGKSALQSGSSNSWAGTAHWKFRRPILPRQRKQTKAAAASKQTGAGSDAEMEEGAAPKPKRRGKRVAFSSDFSAAPEEDDERFAFPAPPAAKKKGKGAKTSNPTQLSEAYVTRLAKSDGSKYTLPKDCHFEAKDLARIFSRPTAIARRTERVDFEAADVAELGSAAGGGMMIGLAADRYDAPGFDEDLSDGEDGGAAFDPGFGDAADGLTMNAELADEDDYSGMANVFLPGIRRVAKIEVKYATRATRIDVRRLKKDIWQHITLPAEPVGDETSDAQDATVPPPAKTFSNVVGTLSANEEQTGVTVPFYFICLLHLANEQGLRLEGMEDMSDIAIDHQ